jgi:hypothetical protein
LESEVETEEFGNRLDGEKEKKEKESEKERRE